MKWARRTALWAAVCAVIALSLLAPEKRAGLTREALLRSRYGGWAGVLRLWTFEGWECGAGSLASWLNAGVAAFEKAHAGVYIQLTEVSEEALRGFADGPANPPDMILFPPGLLDGPANLAPLNGDYALRAGLEACGLAEGARYALPVAMGAYGLVYNRAALNALPAAWRDLPDAPAQGGCAYWLDWPADGPHRRWSRAMASLLADAPAEEAPQTPRAGEGLDLGLPAAAGAGALLPRVLPADFGEAASVYGRFVNGEIAAMPATQREIRRLQLLSESGRAPDWAVAPRAAAYTDQIALLAVTACDRGDLAARQALCGDFAALLTGEALQARLKQARAFPVIDAAPLYAGSEGLAQLEAGLSAAALTPAAAFGGP